MNRRDAELLKAYQASRWLDTVADLNDLVSVRVALRFGGYDEHEIDNMLSDAIRSEKDRRAIARVIRAPSEAACLFAFLGALYLIFAPDRAYAADAERLSDFGWPSTIALTLLTICIVWLCIRAILPPKREQAAEPDTRPFGDTTGYDSTPGWRR